MCGAKLDPSAAPEEPVREEAPAGNPSWAFRSGAAAIGAVIGFSVSYFLGWTLFILVPIVLFGTGSGETRRIITFFAIGLMAGLAVGVTMRILHINL